MCTVKYTPTLGGPHQLSTNIPGSNFTVHVLPSPVMTEAVERRSVVPHTIVGSKSGEVVSKSAHYSRVGKKIKSFGSRWIIEEVMQFDDLTGTAMTSDNKILVADKLNHRIQMCTLKERFMTSVRQFVIY